MTAGELLEGELLELLERAPELERGRTFAPGYWERLDGVRAELRALEWGPVRHRTPGALEAELEGPSWERVPTLELRPGDVIRWPSWDRRPAGSATVRGVRPSGWAGGDWTRVLLCGPDPWLECSGRHTWEALRLG